MKSTNVLLPPLRIDYMLLIFDCDGVLVDSERLAAEVFSEALRTEGISLSAAACLGRFKGHTLEYCYALVERELGSLSAGFGERLSEMTREAFAHSLQPVAGVELILEQLRRENVPYCVASNGGHRKIDHSLEITGLERFFGDNRFSAEDVARGKPAPDLFLHAADVMGVPPRFTRVVEDSVTGVAAAQAAGMQVFWYQAAGMPRPDEIPGDYQLLQALPDLAGHLSRSFATC